MKRANKRVQSFMLEEVLTGKTELHLTRFRRTDFFVHREMLKPLDDLFSSARADRGFDLRVVSSFRGFEAQTRIWNAKALGERAILDDAGNALDISLMSPKEIVFAIMRWSALPGASRHHWGTDFDFFDASSVHENYRLKLITSEYTKGGVFEDASNWLTQNMQNFGFFRPYSQDKGGIAPEVWHLSFAPISETYLKEYSFEVFQRALAASEFKFVEVVRESAEEIFERFILL